MKLKFLGATGTVTGSKYLLATAKARILAAGLPELRIFGETMRIDDA